jgi:hypothetical protein
MVNSILQKRQGTITPAHEQRGDSKSVFDVRCFFTVRPAHMPALKHLTQQLFSLHRSDLRAVALPKAWSRGPRNS